MKPKLYQEVALTLDLPEKNLRKGDVVTLIDYIPHPENGEEGAVLEVFNAIGESLGVMIVPISAIEPLREDQMPAVRTGAPNV